MAQNIVGARTRIDCFTQDALTQIKDTLNGDEVTFPNRCGLGTDVRYLSDFALEQIRGAIGNGGGGGETKRIVSGWRVVSETEFEKIDKKEGEELFVINSFAVSSEAFVFTTDENEPNDTFKNVALLVGLTSQSISTSTFGTTVAIQSQSNENDSTNLVTPTTVIAVFDNIYMENPPYLEIEIRYTPTE